MSKIVKNKAKTREQLANPFYGIPHQERINHADCVNLENNSTIKYENGYCVIRPIDETKKFVCKNCRENAPCEWKIKIDAIAAEREKF